MAWRPSLPVLDLLMRSTLPHMNTQRKWWHNCRHSTIKSITVRVIITGLRAGIILFFFVKTVISAVTATLIHDAISNPTEVIKQRLQMYGSPYKSVMQCSRGVYKTEGMRAFYRSYNTQLIMNLPYQAIHFSTYEFFQNMVSIWKLFRIAIMFTSRENRMKSFFVFVYF